MKKILMIGTGGTIASQSTEFGLTPGLSTEELLSYVPQAADVCEVDSIQVCSIDSTNVTPYYWKLMEQAVEDNYDKYDGFVICHAVGSHTRTSRVKAFACNISDFIFYAYRQGFCGIDGFREFYPWRDSNLMQ